MKRHIAETLRPLAARWLVCAVVLVGPPVLFKVEANELFDPEFRLALFERGVAAGLDEASWIRQGH